MSDDPDFSDGSWAVERRSVINQLRQAANTIVNVQQTVSSTRESMIRIELNIQSILGKLDGNDGVVTSLRSLEVRINSLEGSRTWIKGVMTAVGVGWTLFLIYFASRLKP